MPLLDLFKTPIAFGNRVFLLLVNGILQPFDKTS